MNTLRYFLPIFFCFSPALSADDHLNTIVITATHTEEPEVKTPVSVKIITAKKIQQSGANSLTEVLRTQASITIKDNIGDGSRAYVTMRGFGANSVNNVLIVVDGRKLNNPTLEAPLLSAISLKDIERIEVLQGSGGVLYGDQAVGGVINIITQRFKGDRLELDTIQGSHDLQQYKVNGSQVLGNGFGYRLSAEVKEADNYRDNNEADYSNVYAELAYDATWGHVFYEYSDVDDELNLPGFLSNAQIADDPQQSGNTEEFFNNDITIERLGLAYYLNPNITLDSVLSVRDSDGEVNDFSFSFQDTRVKMGDVKLLGDWSLPQGQLKLTAGYEQLDSDYQKSGSFGQDWQQTQHALYGQIIYPIATGLTVVGGYRAATVEDDNLRENEANDDDLSATEIGVNYRVDNQRYYLRRAEAFRFGNLDENSRTLASVDFLNPQKSVSYEMGYDYILPEFRLSALLYSMTIEDEIYYDSIASANINLEDSQRDGLIIDIEKILSDKLSIGLGLSYSDAEYTSGNFNGNTVPGTPDKTATLFASYQFTDALSFYWDALYTGPRLPDSDNNNSADELPGYTLMNASIGWRKKSWDIGVRVNNLSDKEYVPLLFSSGGYPAPGRTFELSLSYRLF